MFTIIYFLLFPIKTILSYYQRNSKDYAIDGTLILGTHIYENYGQNYVSGFLHLNRLSDFY